MHTRYPGIPGQVSGKENGFTLLEIIIVLTLVTLILGLTTVYFARYLPGVKLDAAAREITALIRHGRSLARSSGEARTVMIDLDARTYGMERGAKPFPPHVLVRIIDPLSGEILQGKYALVFHADGSGEWGTILLSGGGKKIRIDMDPVTGAVLMKGG